MVGHNRMGALDQKATPKQRVAQDAVWMDVLLEVLSVVHDRRSRHLVHREFLEAALGLLPQVVPDPSVDAVLNHPIRLPPLHHKIPVQRARRELLLKRASPGDGVVRHKGQIFFPSTVDKPCILHINTSMPSAIDGLN